MPKTTVGTSTDVRRCGAVPDPPFMIRPHIRPYAWGDSASLCRLLALPAQQAAEAWYGAHPAGPATVTDEGGEQGLDRLVAHADVLPSHIADRFGGHPYLLKVLAVAQPLSLQAHPDARAARIGFEREEQAGLAPDDPTRCYRDPNAKPELLVALTPFHALAGFRPDADVPRLLAEVPELGEPTRTVESLVRRTLTRPLAEVRRAVGTLLDRLSRATTPSPDTWQHWVLRAAEVHDCPEARLADRGLLLLALLEPVTLSPGEGLFLPPGCPHVYLQGAGVEIMASSDNVVRCGLTIKHTDPDEFARVVDFETGLPRRTPAPEGEWSDHTLQSPCPAFELTLATLPPGHARSYVAHGLDTLVNLSEHALVVRTDRGRVLLERGRACVLPHGCPYEVLQSSTRDAPTRLVRATVPPHPWLRRVAQTRALFTGRESRPASTVGVVTASGSATAQWQQRLQEASSALMARTALALHEDLPVNQALGLLLLWKRVRRRLTAGEGALFAFAIGRGRRASPFTEAEGGQKPALATFAEGFPPIALLALWAFAPVEAFLRRSGFDGMVVKWGDEVQIPSCDLSGCDPRFASADVVRFVSMRRITEADATSKDWIGVDPAGAITAFIPRRPLAQMEALADRGWLHRDQGALWGGVNIGSIALSRRLLDALLQEFRADVDDPHADASTRPDLDPQLFTALTIARISDRAARTEAWRQAIADSPAIEALSQTMPDVLDRLGRVIEAIEAHGPPLRMVALDVQEPFWGDVGEHRRMRAFVMALNGVGPRAEVARSLAGIEHPRDARGNIVVDSTIAPGTDVRDSVLIGVHVASGGSVVDSVLVGTHADTVHANGSFDLFSTVTHLHSGPDAGSYKVVSADAVEVGPGERLTTVFLETGPVHLRAHEDLDLREDAHYDEPILGNPVSLREAHAAACALPFERMQRARQQRIREVRDAIAQRSAGAHPLR